MSRSWFDVRELAADLESLASFLEGARPIAYGPVDGETRNYVTIIKDGYEETLHVDRILDDVIAFREWLRTLPKEPPADD